MQKTKVTIKDVAIEANVSTQTVSRVFRNQGYFSEETKKKVMLASSNLGYVPNQAAISLRCGNTKTIVVIFDSLVNIYFAIMIDYLHRELQKHNYALRMIFSGDSMLNDDNYKNALSIGASGIISFLEPKKSVNSLIKNLKVPVLVLGRTSKLKYVDYISTDDKKGGQIAAERLLQDKCNSFVFVGDGLGITAIDDRLEGYSKRLKNENYDVEIWNYYKDLKLRIKKLRKNDNNPIGIFCSSDMVAFKTLQLLKENNVKNVMVIGYDDLQADINLPTRITSIGVDKEKYAEFAVDELLKKIENDDEMRIEKKFNVSLKAGPIS